MTKEHQHQNKTENVSLKLIQHYNFKTTLKNAI